MTAISSIQIRHFQSLTNVSLTLAPFTVIVGPSSSGKSAFVRSLQTLAHNQRGSSFITQGQPGCSISATLPTATVTLTRTKASSASDFYKILPVTPDHLVPERSRLFTKLGGSTPPEVTALLGQIADPTAIASQFDPPFLLTQSPAEAARTLASITQAHLPLEAARESNRRKLDAAGTLRLRRQDLDSTASELETHRNHAVCADALQSAEWHIQQAAALQHRLAQLEGLVNSISAIAFGVRLLREQLDQQLQLPDLDGLADAANKISRLGQLTSSISDAAARRHQLQLDRDALEHELGQLGSSISAHLHELGVCPTCGQSTAQL